jgi:signal transduction histidine kinase/phage shock protein PspC (stress-responsive transcriptional regulator)
MARVSTHPLPPLRRDREHAVLGGVCAALGARIGVDPILLRVGFIAGSVAGGMGALLYLLAWVAIPARGARAPGRALPRLGRKESWQVATGIALIVLGLLLVLRQLGVWFSDAIVWPVVLAAAGGALIWRQSMPAEPRDEGRGALAAPAPDVQPGAPRLALPSLGGAQAGRALLGAALVVGGGLVFLDLNGALQPARDVVLAVLVALVALTLIAAPWWLRLVRGLAAERAERIRSQERAELAAHLHDSVLQTLALVQRRAEDPRAVAQLARRQERELRAWLTAGRPPGGPTLTLAAALEAAAAEVEETHGVPVEVVAVGDRPLDECGEALVAAAREALVNAAKFAGAAGPVSLYAEVEDARTQVFVRDRGPGFDPGGVPPDRRGLRESIVGRMARHGGRATVHTAPGAGTEVELCLEGGAA